jgi:hypothetical protein
LHLKEQKGSHEDCQRKQTHCLSVGLAMVIRGSPLVSRFQL